MIWDHGRIMLGSFLLGRKLLLLRPLAWTFHLGGGSIISVIFVAATAFGDLVMLLCDCLWQFGEVAMMLASNFSWQAQYLVTLDWPAHCTGRFVCCDSFPVFCIPQVALPMYWRLPACGTQTRMP